MRIIFCGTPEFAVPALRRLIAEPGISVEAVITQPDRPRGRGQEVSESAVKSAALEAGLHVFQPEKIRSDSAFEFLNKIKPDAVAIIAYGQIVPAKLLTIPRLGWINLHASLLPKYRGAAPIHWAVASGETVSGLTSMQIDPGMDTGPTLLEQRMEIGPDETAPELAARMSKAGAPLMVETLKKFDLGEILPRPQNHELASMAPMLKKEDGRIEWSRTASQIYNRMRGFTPWPGAYTSLRGQACQVWGRPAANSANAGSAPPGTIELLSGSVHVACGEGTWLQLESVQLEGRKRITAKEFANGARLTSTDAFQSSAS
jgi:methionyl-tRNA formyltransferase